MIKRSLPALAGLASLLVLAACGSSSTTATPSSGGSGAASSVSLVDPGTLTVCSDVPYAPFEDFDSSAPSGFKGFDIDLVSNIAKDMGVKLKVLKESFTGLASGLTLNAGTCDLVASAMTITPDRAQHLLFSDPYYNSEQSLLVPDGSPITSIADLSGKKVAVQKGTTGETYAQQHATGATVLSFPSDAEEFSALKAGQVDAILQDLPVNIAHQISGGYKVVQKYDTGEKYGFAAKLGNTALIAQVDKDLKKMKSDGTYKKLYDEYFTAK